MAHFSNSLIILVVVVMLQALSSKEFHIEATSADISIDKTQHSNLNHLRGNVNVETSRRSSTEMRNLQTLSSSPTNIALGKPTQQSSDYNSYYLASLAVDGNTSGNLLRDNSATHTKTETNPWWEVDLQSNHNINQIKVYGRTDCCKDRLNGFILQIIRYGAEVWKYQHTGVLYDITVIEVPYIKGDRVKISLEGNYKILSLAEVEVYSKIPIKTIDLDPTIKLGRCEGDCDSDNDCKTGLKCFHTDNYAAGPPECSGSIFGLYDYCYLPPMITAIDNPCTDHYADGKCEVCSGDCDSDSDCAGDLVCYERSGDYGVGYIPGCSWDPNFGIRRRNWDYCK